MVILKPSQDKVLAREKSLHFGGLQRAFSQRFATFAQDPNALRSMLTRCFDKLACGRLRREGAGMTMISNHSLHILVSTIMIRRKFGI